MTKRPRIAEDFFDATFSESQSKPAPMSPAPPTPTAVETSAPTSSEPPPRGTSPKGVRAPRGPKTVKTTVEAQDDAGKVRTTLYIREELHEKARWAILNLERAPRSISQLMESALERELERLGKVHGMAIERHRMALPGGRPRVTP